MTDDLVLVTGATGNVGAHVVPHLLEHGLRVRTGDRAPGRRADAAPGVESVALDLTDPATFAPALADVDRVFLLRPPAIARVGPTVNAFVDAAVAAGVTYVAFLSVAGAASNPVVPHHRIESHLEASPLAWTMLRPGFFAQNLASAYLADIRDDDRIHVPAGDGEVAFVDTRDLGELAALVLADPAPHVGRGYTLTGPRAVTFAEVASSLSQALARPIRYEPATVVGYLRHLARAGLGVPQRLVQTVLHVGLRRGDAAEVDPTLARLLGRPARGIDDYLADHTELFAHRPSDD